MADRSGITVAKDGKGRLRYRVRVTWVDAYGAEHAERGTFDTEEEALKHRDEWRLRRHRDDLVVTSRSTIKEYAADWMKQNERDGLSAYTLAGYTSKLKYVISSIGEMPLEKVKRPHTRKVMNDAQDRRHHRTGEPLSKDTIAGIQRVMHNLFAAAVDDGLITTNPASAVRRRRKKQDSPSARTRDRESLTPEQVDTVTKAARATGDDRLYVAVMLAKSAGLRRGEVLALRWRDVELDKKRLHVRRAMVWVKGARFEPPKTPESERTVPLTEEAVRELAEYKKRQDAMRQIAENVWEDEQGLVITNERGMPWHPNKLSRAFAALAKSCQ